MKRLLPAFEGGAVLALTLSAAAQTHPSRPITMIIPLTPGGSTDDDVVVKSLRDKAVRKRLVDLSQGISPHEQLAFEALGTFQKAETVKWRLNISAAGIRGERGNHADL